MIDDDQTGLLSDLRVLDLGRFIAAPLCGAMLADLGADVIRIESPAGAADRTVMPIGNEIGGALYLQLNRNKRSLTLDIESDGGRTVFEKLVRTADVVVANMPPGQLARAGLDYKTLRAIKNDIVLTTVSAYSTQGPNRNRTGFDGTGQALTGAMHITGTDQGPMRAAVSYVDYTTGIAAAYGTVAALLDRIRTGKGQHVEASLMASAITVMNPILIEAATGTRYRSATGNRSPISGPSDAFRTLDGWIMVQVIGDRMFERWAAVVQRPDLISDPSYASDIDRGENGIPLSEIAAGWAVNLTTADALARLSEARVPCVPILSPSEALDHPEISQGGFFSEASLANAPVVGPLARMSGTVAGRPAPALGQHTNEILQELDRSLVGSAGVGATSPVE